MPGDATLLSVDGVTVVYDRAAALRRVSLEVVEGEIVALLGANGAGKTSTLRCISGLVPPSEGVILFAGRSLRGLSPAEIVRLGISHVPEGRRIFPRLTVYDNLQLGGYALERALLRERLKRILSEFPVLSERRAQYAGTLSGGEQQMLALGRALMMQPRLLLLDEPSLGLAPIVVQGLFERLRAIVEKGVTILLVEQNARLALATADRAYVLERGEVVCAGTAREVAADERVFRAYLGGELEASAEAEA